MCDINRLIDSGKPLFPISNCDPLPVVVKECLQGQGCLGVQGRCRRR